jgi:hypothetical protein
MLEERMCEDDKYRLLSERILNESWSNVELFKKEIGKILEKGRVESDREMSLIMMAANAFFQKVTLNDAESCKLDLVSSGQECDSCKNCSLKECTFCL